ncbi:MAG: peptide chain release factor N(5)-glutamine methyltransferase [Candidatus Sericytochromatia bacterium]|nr:peptide chain release factor N(5)-glutamine methyltransferase [Candidatus Sericytochromatia bacterium]
MQSAEARRWLAGQLAAAGIDEADYESCLLLKAVGVSALDLRTAPHQQLRPEQREQLSHWLKRRQQREPLQYILGEAWFYGLRLQVSPAVLIPRPETEELVEKALPHLPPGARVADIGTGSGAIALALAAQRPDLTVYATDISADALAQARANAEALGLNIQFLSGDTLEPLRPYAPFEALISNPPYIPQQNIAGLAPEVRDFEPQLALTPGPDALHFYRCFAAEAAAYLRLGGQLWLELEAPLAQQTAALFNAPLWHELQLLRDLSGHWRFLTARSGPAS